MSKLSDFIHNLVSWGKAKAPEVETEIEDFVLPGIKKLEAVAVPGMLAAAMRAVQAAKDSGKTGPEALKIAETMFVGDSKSLGKTLEQNAVNYILETAVQKLSAAGA